MHKIFDVYRPGCYFLYVNQDSTKYDSLYISDYESGVAQDHLETCLSADWRRFYLNSTYLSESRAVYVTYERFIGHDYAKFTARPADAKNYISDVGVYFYCIDDKKNLFKNDQASIPYEKIMYYPLWNNPPVILEDVVISRGSIGGRGDIYFSAYLGIAQFITHDLKDTFKIYKNYVP